MSPEDRIDSVGAYRGVRVVKEGSVFAKYKVKKKLKKEHEEEAKKEEESSSKKESSEHKIDIEA